MLGKIYAALYQTEVLNNLTEEELKDLTERVLSKVEEFGMLPPNIPETCIHGWEDVQ